MQGIEAINSGEVGVRSLQEHAARLRGGEPRPGRPRSDRRPRASVMTHGDIEGEAGPVQVRGTVLTVRRVDAYHAMTIVAPGIAARFKPGQFVALAVGGPVTPMLLRRAFSIHDVRPDHGGTVEFVFAANGPGTQWLAERRARDVLDVTGPLGPPVPGARATRSAACWSAAATAARRCSRWPAGCASAAARSTSCSARPPATGCSAR